MRMYNEGLGSLKTIYQRSIPQVLLVGHVYTHADLTECERDCLDLPDLLIGYLIYMKQTKINV